MGQPPAGYGEIACRAWTESHQAHHPCNMTQWEDLSDEDRATWDAAAQAVAEYLDRIPR